MSQSTDRIIGFRRFEADDILKINLRDIEIEDIDGLPLYALGRQWEYSQIAHTLFDGKNIIACGGVLIDNNKQGIAWIFTSDDICKHSLRFFKKVKSMLESAFSEYGAIRVQTLVLSSNKTSCNFVERLGFVREGLMRKCLHNAKDRYIYARLEQ